MTTSFTYVIKFVGNMDKAVQFHVDQLGLKLRFQSPTALRGNCGGIFETGER